MRDRIKQWIDQHDHPDYPLIPAATVLLVRDTSSGPETVLMRRNLGLSFAEGAWVFPGGRIDPADYHEPDDHMGAAVRAAVRETHEEAGLRVGADSLQYYSHWIPPPQAPKRFSTWFFVARAPEGEVTVDQGEILEHAWCRPADALERAHDREMEILPPTWMTLHDLAQFESVDDVLAAVRKRGPLSYATKMVSTADGPAAVWEDDVAYADETEPDAPGPRHRLVITDGPWRLERSAHPEVGLPQMTGDEIAGLTLAEVREREAAGRINVTPEGTQRRVSQIVVANVFNPVNAIMLALFVLIMIAGFPADGLFVGVVASNSIIGIAQELYARRALKKLELLNAPLARVRRDSLDLEIQIAEIVADEVFVLAPGDQIVVDGTVLEAAGLQIDESLLTGEADPIDKHVGDEVLSGSFVNAGSGVCQATRIGAESYANTLAEEAKRFRPRQQRAAQRDQLHSPGPRVLDPTRERALVDLASRCRGSLAGSAPGNGCCRRSDGSRWPGSAHQPCVRSRSHRPGPQESLAKELATVELLARVDTLCLDKTGTITTGDISFGSIVPLGEYTEAYVAAALGSVAAAIPTPIQRWPRSRPNSPRATIGSHRYRAVQLPSESGRDRVRQQGTFFFGRQTFFSDDEDDVARDRARAEAELGRRVLLLSRSEGPLGDRELPTSRGPVALILLEDTVRLDAPEILRFFADQGVQLKVISGDNVATVAAVAARAGVPDPHSIDGRPRPTRRPRGHGRMRWPPPPCSVGSPLTKSGPWSARYRRMVTSWP